MPIERTLADPLSTQEIKEIALQEFRKRMDANSLLADGLTYSGFKLDFHGTFTLPGREHWYGLRSRKARRKTMNHRSWTTISSTARHRPTRPARAMI